MPTTFDIVTIDSPDTERLAAFWAAVLGFVEVEREDGDRWIVIGEAGHRRVGFQRGEHRAGGTHLDVQCSPEEFTAELDRVVELGAEILAPPRREPYGSIANLADPDGNPFDLCAYQQEGPS